MSKIEWTDATWNPIRARNLKTGKVGWHCEHATTGCKFCYSEGFNLRLGTGLPFKPGHRKDIEIFLDENMLLAPLRWKKPRMIFVCSMTDAFADFVKDEWLDKMFAVMALCPQHTFQVLTKRAERMRAYCNSRNAVIRIYHIVCDLVTGGDADGILIAPGIDPALAPPGERIYLDAWPLPNVWLGVSAERQQEADERIPLLLQTPAAIRFVSCEPLLGPIDFSNISPVDADWNPRAASVASMIGLHWIIAGGESGHRARPSHPDWYRSLRDQCAAAGVPFFFKQWGEWLPWSQFNESAVDDGEEQTRYRTMEWRSDRWVDVGYPMWCDTYDGNIDGGHCSGRVRKKKAGRTLDGRLHDEFPVVT